MFDFEEANKMLESEETEICIPSTELAPLTAEKALEEIKSKIDIKPLVAQAQGYEIANVEQATQALSMALQARKLVTALIDSKREITRPQMDFQKAVNKLVNDYTDKLKDIEVNLTKKIEEWIDTSTQQGFTSGLDSIQVPDGNLKRVNTWEFDIEDSHAIPFEFMCPDIEAIEKAVKAGVRQIPGVKISLKQEVKLMVKN